ncbi:unnamed protein product [Prunus armeniaca]|uniref:Uncharacterized protein n=1 Tax=Prunus armeniaca TaxID=36596 RepID=A0A6J5UW15_PRUAR|nr:unnamed protein product [Prunus armeniaca]
MDLSRMRGSKGRKDGNQAFGWTGLAVAGGARLTAWDVARTASVETTITSFNIKIQWAMQVCILVDKDWFLFEVTRIFGTVKPMDNVPVVLDWNLKRNDYGERFREKPDLTGNYSTPICRRNNVT